MALLGLGAALLGVSALTLTVYSLWALRDPVRLGASSRPLWLDLPPPPLGGWPPSESTPQVSATGGYLDFENINNGLIFGTSLSAVSLS